jgi:predicted DNA-binding protein
MPLSLRIPPETESRLSTLAKRKEKTKAALILEALDEQYHLKKDRAQLVRETAGWMSKAESETLRRDVSELNEVEERDWP